MQALTDKEDAGEEFYRRALQLEQHEGNVVEARRHFLLAAQQGHVKAQTNLAAMLRLGCGGEMDYVEARRLLRLSTAQGDADAMNILASMIWKGEGGAKDPAEARRLFGVAAAQGDARAQGNLG